MGVGGRVAQSRGPWEYAGGSTGRRSEEVGNSPRLQIGVWVGLSAGCHLLWGPTGSMPRAGAPALCMAGTSLSWGPYSRDELWLCVPGPGCLLSTTTAPRRLTGSGQRDTRTVSLVWESPPDPGVPEDPKNMRAPVPKNVRAPVTAAPGSKPLAWNGMCLLAETPGPLPDLPFLLVLADAWGHCIFAPRCCISGSVSSGPSPWVPASTSSSTRWMLGLSHGARGLRGPGRERWLGPGQLQAPEDHPG